MKALLILFLCGVTCCIAAPPCSMEEFGKCSSGKMTYKEVETEAELDELCSDFFGAIDCQLDFTKRCPYHPYELFREDLLEQKRIFGLFCEKGNALRQKFLENAKCLNKFMKEVDSLCGPPIDSADKDICPKLKRMLQCFEEKVDDRCGAGSKDVIFVVHNREYLLRRYKCL